MEHDNGSPQQYRELVDVKASQSLLSSAANPSTARRAALLVDDVNNVLNAIDVPIPFAFDDDHLGTRLLPLDSSDLLKGGMKEKRMVISGDGGEYELVFRIRYRGWEHSVPGLADVVHVLPGTRPTSWYTPTDNVQHIAYVGTDQEIHELFFFLGTNDTEWHHNVPSGKHDVRVMPGTSPTSWYTPKDNVQHVAYVGTDQHIHECFFFLGVQDADWAHNVPSGVQPVGALPGTSPTSWYTPKDNVQHIAYVGTDQQIHEPFFRLDP